MKREWELRWPVFDGGSFAYGIVFGSVLSGQSPAWALLAGLIFLVELRLDLPGFKKPAKREEEEKES